MSMRRYAVIGSDLVVSNVVLAPFGWLPGLGETAVVSEAANPGDMYDPVQGVFLAPPGRLEALRAQVRDEVQTRRDSIMAAGAPYGGQRVEVDDASRANLNSVVTAAILAQMGAAPWPEAVQGWISLDNTIIPLPTPGDAITMGLTVLQWQAGLIQFGRALKDAVLAAEDPRAVASAADWSAWEGGEAPQAEAV